jgi:hypothetical protein
VVGPDFACFAAARVVVKETAENAIAIANATVEIVFMFRSDEWVVCPNVPFLHCGAPHARLRLNKDSFSSQKDDLALHKRTILFLFASSAFSCF